MTPVIIMAGGRGLRLHPLTEHTPKPMLHVGSKPMLEHIIGGFVGQGFTDITLAVHYKADLIEGYFGDGSAFGCKISYIRETQPMGTAGALGLFCRARDDQRAAIVSNADVLTTVDYRDLVDTHRAGWNDITACLALHQQQVPFGVATVEGGRLVSVAEKPVASWPVLAGIYVVEPQVMAGIIGYTDMPDVLTEWSVGTYDIVEPWQDIGHFEALARANA